jgi:hypothetical protein
MAALVRLPGANRWSLSVLAHGGGKRGEGRATLKIAVTTLTRNAPGMAVRKLSMTKPLMAIHDANASRRPLTTMMKSLSASLARGRS